MVGLNDPEGLSQHKWFYDSIQGMWQDADVVNSILY